MGIGQVKKMYREHKEYAAEDGWLRQMEDFEHRPDMLTCYENIIGEACRVLNTLSVMAHLNACSVQWM
jgi:hypothetical protein